MPDSTTLHGIARVRQRGRHDCGVACLAMAAGIAYEDAARAFVAVGLDADRPRGRPAWSSNFTELAAAAGAAGLALAMRRFRSWDEVDTFAIVKVAARAEHLLHSHGFRLAAPDHARGRHRDRATPDGTSMSNLASRPSSAASNEGARANLNEHLPAPRPWRGWHWVLALRGGYGIEIVDPGTDLASAQILPFDRAMIEFERYAPTGNILVPV